MDFRVVWVGYSKIKQGRFWGYLEHASYNSGLAPGSFNRYYYTFWGTTGGRIFFGITRCDNPFKHKCRQQQLKYTEFMNVEFNEMIIDEFSQLQVLGRLRGI